MDALYTQAAQTVQAQLTEQALSTLTAPTNQTESNSSSSLTPVITIPAQSSPTATPTMQPTPTATLPLPTPLPPTPTSVPILCDHAGFIDDVTIADGTTFSPGAEFTKIWRLKNIGSCTWNSSYSLEFVSGDSMRNNRSLPLPGNVRPGETVDLAVDLLAPAGEGKYRGYWMLSDADGELFGIGKQADKSFWVEIKVTSPNQRFAYDFAVNMCTATWRSSSGSLSCPSDPDSRDGSVTMLERPKLENGRTEDESTLWSRPEETRDGWIQGVYPPYKIREGDHFLAQVGCLAD
ncbi:MAG: NBR1-Ig-like domain-containing protein, partial [Anaerolineales bacterium]